VEPVSFELPWPPSLNRYYRHVGPRVLISREGRQYRMKTVSRLGGAFPKFTASVRLKAELFPPDKRRRDIDNSLKCLLDSLTHAGIYADDSLVKDLELHMMDPVPPDGMVHVTIEER
jgi:crossover junction endodeoxyribonuclease RusA